jgi:hypothetical protein
VFDPQAGEGAADLGQAPAIRGAARHRGVHGPVGAVGVEGHGQAVTHEDRPQGGHDGYDAFPAVPELGMEQALGGVVDDGDEGEPLIGDAGEPVMAAAVEMQQLAEAGAGLTAPAVAAAGAVLGHEPGALQGLLDEGVAEADAVLPARELVEVADVEPLIAVAIEREQALDLDHGSPLRRGHLPPAIEQPVIAVVLQLPPQPPDAAGAAAQDLGGLNPGELPVQGSHDDFVDLHGTLHGAGWIEHGHLLGSHSSHPTRLKRSCHGSLPSGQITYPQHRSTTALDAPAGRAYSLGASAL